MSNLDEVKLGLTFDDLLIQPSYSDFLPSEVDTSTWLTKNIRLNIPIISACMDTVTGAQMAIAMAQEGGLGVIHKNLTIEEQANKVRKVKKFEAGMVTDPVTIYADATIADVLSSMEEHNISGIPVIDRGSNKLVGIITNRDVRFAKNKKQLVSEMMTKENLVTAAKNISTEKAKALLHKHRIEKLIIVDDDYRCIGLITVKDMEMSERFPHSCKDDNSRLRAAAAIGASGDNLERAAELISAGVDALVVDTAHGHSKNVIDSLVAIKKKYSDVDVIAGNIATLDAAKALADAGADAIKVGIGPGSICTTRIVAGVGVPQLSAVQDISAFCKKKKIPVIADGGIKYSGDLAKAIGAGSSVVMVGSLLGGTEESPGEVILYQGRYYKVYRGMGSIGAMQKGSADRYAQDNVQSVGKFVPQGVEGRVPFRGPVSDVIHQLVGGLKASMGYTGNKTIKEMQENCKFVKITAAGLNESHVHNITVTKEAPNYSS